MGTKRDARPPPPAAQQPLDSHALNAALRLFVSTFVVDDKRSQIHKRLLASERRLETLASLPRWIAVGTAPLEGADRSPAGLRARLGDITGIRLTEDGASRTTIARALELDRGTSSLFIADNGHVAMITIVGGPRSCVRGWESERRNPDHIVSANVARPRCGRAASVAPCDGGAR